MSKKHAHRSATTSEIVQIVGPIGDEVIAHVIATGATVEEPWPQLGSWFLTDTLDAPFGARAAG